MSIQNTLKDLPLHLQFVIQKKQNLLQETYVVAAAWATGVGAGTDTVFPENVKEKPEFAAVEVVEVAAGSAPEGRPKPAAGASDDDVAALAVVVGPDDNELIPPAPIQSTFIIRMHRHKEAKYE